MNKTIQTFLLLAILITVWYTCYMVQDIYQLLIEDSEIEYIDN